MEKFLIVSFDHKFRLSESSGDLYLAKEWQWSARVEDCVSDFNEATNIALKIHSEYPNLEVLVFTFGYFKNGLGEPMKRSTAAFGVMTVNGNTAYFTDSPERYANA